MRKSVVALYALALGFGLGWTLHRPAPPTQDYSQPIRVYNQYRQPGRTFQPFAVTVRGRSTRYAPAPEDRSEHWIISLGEEVVITATEVK